ncbi:MAG: hypothetical protein J5737_00170 [Bacteroidales bacterium]|nr:hypothetical protein [Bacteroidales bacterium]
MQIQAGRVYQMPYPRIKHIIKIMLFSLAGRDWISRRLAGKLQKQLDRDYDIILSLCSNDRFWALEAGACLKRSLGLPWACYCVDAIPAPAEWIGNGPYRNAWLRLWKKIGGNIDYLASICDEMLAYQKSVIPDLPPVPAGTFLPPVSGSLADTKPYTSENPVFLYAGRIYGRRTAVYLLEAFSMFLKDYPEAELVLLGLLSDFERALSGCPQDVSSHIRVEPWTDDVQYWIDRSTALIDLDADIPGDIYLSSKMFTYLLQKRPIICETGSDSPSRRIFKGIPSILQCGHDALQLYQAMCKAAGGSADFDYSDRLGIIGESHEAPARLVKDLEILVLRK